jgi:hypothetical protein
MRNRARERSRWQVPFPHGNREQRSVSATLSSVLLPFDAAIIRGTTTATPFARVRVPQCCGMKQLIDCGSNGRHLSRSFSGGN